MKAGKAIPAIQTRQLSIGYQTMQKKNLLFENLNMELRQGELTCFMGPNGIGKSTLIRTLIGLQKPLSGEIFYGEKTEASSLYSLPKNIAVVLTDRITAVNMTVYDLVSFGRYPYLHWNTTLRQEDIQIINRSIEQVQIQNLIHKKIHELSDGQLQMAMIARALSQDTPIILLDEPTAHLDLNNRLEIMNLLRKLARTMHKAILVATHELDLALQTADLIWLAGRNKNILTGIPEDLVLTGAFDEIFQFKGFDLKTGEVQHEVYRNETITLLGESHEYLWTKNALERSGFCIVEESATFKISIINGLPVKWMIDDTSEITSIRGLLFYLENRSTIWTV